MPDHPLKPHDAHHVFLGADHARSEGRTWAVIWLCGAVMVAEIAGGLAFGSIALVADGLHMTTHAGALLLAALAYRFARRYARDARFTFGTGKLGDLAGFTSAVALTMIALLIAWEAIDRLFHPQPIAFAEAIPIACLGLAVNLASAWLLAGGHEHGHDHGHSHGHDHPHARDNNMRAALLHIIADAAVSVMVIFGLVLALAFGWVWMDPLAGLVGAVVIASWAWTLIRDTGAILLDMNPDPKLTEHVEQEIATDGDRVSCLHLWRVGPGHLAAELSVETASERTAADYRDRLKRFPTLSHVTVEVQRREPVKPAQTAVKIAKERDDPRARLVGLNHIALEVGDLEAALAFYGRIFAFNLRGKAEGMAFLDLGDQFIALVEGPVRAAPGDRHFGLVVDDRATVSALATAAGAVLLEGPFLDFLDPWGNRVEVVAYADIQFTKADPVLRAMQLDLPKTEAATNELRAKGMALWAGASLKEQEKSKRFF